MKKILGTIFAVLSMCFMCIVSNAQVYYVSSTGTASNSGTAESAPTTFASVYSKTGSEKEIVVIDDMTYDNASSAYSGKVIIKGKTPTVNLTLPSTVSLKGDLEIDNVNLKTAATIFANGKNLKIGSNTTSTDRLTVYGGKNGAAVTGDTNVILLGGLYKAVCGGGNGTAGTVSGNTNVVFGGNSNKDDGINDDDKTTLSPCYIYGGGNNASVLGKTNVTLQDNAVAYFIVGTGAGVNGALVKDTNIYINGGKVMNVYGGSNTQSVTGCDSHITMNGGMAEALFGGCQSQAFSGNTYINLLGGEVTRRVYTGCYNEVGRSGLSIKYSSDYYVTGTTTISFSPGAQVNTQNGLSSDNKNNIGVFSGSRTKAQHDAEQNTIIYLDNCYSTYSGTIGEKSLTGMLIGLKSFQDYIVKSSVGGKVNTTGTKGQLYIEPDKGYYGAIGSNYYINEQASIPAGTTEVKFGENLLLKSLTTTVTDTGISANVGYGAKNVKGEKSPQIIVSVFDNETKRFVGCDMKSAEASLTSVDFNVSGMMEQGKIYIVKAMMWSGDGKVLADAKTISVQK